MVTKKTPVETIVEALKKADITIEERNVLITSVLDKLAVLPLRDIIIYSPDGSLIVNGKSVDLEVGKQLQSGADAILRNYAFKFIHDQVRYAAINSGFINSTSEGQSLGGKMALWAMDNFLDHLIKLAQVNSSN